ncbi:MAG: hypothetical protein AAGA55_05260 [Planctomycetota bacterium]
MKGVLGWIKKNLLIVISVLVILVFLPVGFVFSSGWNKSIKETASEEFNQQRGQLQRAGSVTYALPAVFEGEESVSESRVPNRAVTAFYEDQKRQRIDQVTQVVERGMEFNRGEHGVLVEGLLPEASSERARRQLGLEMAELISGTVEPDGTIVRPSVYRGMLRRFNAGEPVVPEDLGATLSEFRDRETQRYTSQNTDTNLTEEQRSALDKDLAARRLGEYAGRANALAFYASLEAFRDAGEQRWTGVPEPRQTDVTSYDPVTESVAYRWQWDHWIIADLLEAFVLANTDPATGAATVTSGVLKRVERVRIESFEVSEAAPSEDDDFGGGRFGGRGGGRGGGDPAADPGFVTFTGRRGGTADSPFDIRMVEVTAVVATQKLPRLLDGLGRINNMTVVGLDLEPVDVWGDLEQGYFYGSDHVMRATLLIETVWLRAWTEPLMPDPVRTRLGLPPRASAEGEFDDP